MSDLPGLMQGSGAELSAQTSGDVSAQVVLLGG